MQRIQTCIRHCNPSIQPACDWTRKPFTELLSKIFGGSLYPAVYYGFSYARLCSRNYFILTRTWCLVFDPDHLAACTVGILMSEAVSSQYVFTAS